MPQTTRRSRTSRVRLWFAALMIGAGLVLTGQATYMTLKALLAQVLLDRAFTETLARGGDVKPWPWADTSPVARIEVPRIGASAVVLSGDSGQALAFGPGHLQSTPEPGESGTTVFAAHRDTHFVFLGAVRPGDTIVVTRRDRSVHRFRVTRVHVVRWDQSGIDPAAPGQNLVLATCWPLDARAAGPMRLLVHAELIHPGAPG